MRKVEEYAYGIPVYVSEISELKVHHSNEIQGYLTEISELKVHHSNEIQGYLTEISKLKQMRQVDFGRNIDETASAVEWSVFYPDNGRNLRILTLTVTITLILTP